MKLTIFSLVISLLLITSCSDFSKKIVDATKLNDEGLELMYEGNYEGAVQKFKAASNGFGITKSERSTMFRNAAITYDQWGNADSAKKYYQLAAKAVEHGSYQNLINSAEVKLIEDNIPGAIELFEKAMQEDASGFETYNVLGLIYLGEYGDEYTDLEKAEINNKKAYDMNGDVNTEFALAKTYYYNDKFEEAEHHAQNLLTKYPADLDYKLMLATIKYDMGKEDEGKRLAQELINSSDEYAAYVGFMFEDIES